MTLITVMIYPTDLRWHLSIEDAIIALNRALFVIISLFNRLTVYRVDDQRPTMGKRQKDGHGFSGM